MQKESVLKIMKAKKSEMIEIAKKEKEYPLIKVSSEKEEMLINNEDEILFLENAIGINLGRHVYKIKYDDINEIVLN